MHLHLKEREGPSEEQEDGYYSIQDEYRQKFRELGRQLHNGEITPEQFRARMRGLLLAYYVLLAELGDYDSEEDFEELEEEFLDDAYQSVDDLMGLIESGVVISLAYLMWRAGIFSNARSVYTRFTMLKDVYYELPFEIGVDCLGDGACQCSWFLEQVGNTLYAYVVLGVSEHCAVCLAASIDSPFVISLVDDL